MRVIVAEDNLFAREGVVKVLEDSGVEVAAQVDDAVKLLREATTLRPDAVVVDIRMPPTHTDEGLVAARRVRAALPDVGVLVLSQYVEPAYALRLLEEHVTGSGYLLKDRVFEGAVLVDALRRVTEGETVVDPTIVARLFHRPRTDDPLARLSVREREVLGLLAEGLSNRAIAERLVVSDRTVEAHITSVFAKLGLSEDAGTHRRVLAVLAFLRR